jgi:hypothetical protein
VKVIASHSATIDKAKFLVSVKLLSQLSIQFLKFFLLNHLNRLSGPTLPTVPCILGLFKVHHVLCDWGAIMNILPKMVYDYLDEDPLVPTPHQLRPADSAIMQPYEIAKDVLIEF